MQPDQVELTLEQQLSLRSFELQAGRMSREQAQQFLVQLYEQMLVREAIYKHLIGCEWGFKNPSGDV